MIPHFYESIPGWFNFQDIYREAVERARDGAVFVEVGTWLGRSAAFMATEIANSGKRIKFYCVDTWKGSPAPQYQSVARELEQRGRSVYEEFLINMTRGGLVLGGHFNTMISDSVEAAKAFEDGSLDFVFIDGAHDFHSVSRDVQAWLPKVAVNGLIGGHDANCPGLMNAVKQWIEGVDIFYKGTSWYWRRAARDQCPALADRGGVPDRSLEEWTPADYARRLHLQGFANSAAAALTRAPVPPTPPDRYIAKWGGPPGAETFDFPYGITTKDW